jgi:hypothetical protein
MRSTPDSETGTVMLTGLTYSEWDALCTMMENGISENTVIMQKIRPGTVSALFYSGMAASVEEMTEIHGDLMDAMFIE